MARICCALTAALIGAAACAGCRNPPQVYDPFLGRTTVEPPGTATMAPAAPPYYSSPAASTVGPPIVSQPAGTVTPAAPPPTTPPPIPYSVPQGFAPAPAGYGSVTPNAASPTGSPVPTAIAGGARPNYGPPGGMAFPQLAAAAQQPTLAQGAAPGLLRPESTSGAVDIRNSAAASGPTAATRAGWQAADNSRSAGAAPAEIGTSPAAFSAPSSGNGTIRIVEPTTPAANASSAGAPGEFRPAGTTSLVAPAQTNSTDAVGQPLQRLAPVEFTSLPPVRRASYNGVPVSNSVPSAAASTSNYGYDAQYRWVRGKLEYSQSARSWRLRYIPPEAANDNYGGSVILDDANKLAGLQPGEYVVAYGSIGQAGADNGSFAALYHVERIEKQ